MYCIYKLSSPAGRKMRPERCQHCSVEIGTVPAAFRQHPHLRVYSDDQICANMDSKFGALTIQELKVELKKRNARLSGRKHDLVERLIAYDRNQNFGKAEILEPEYMMILPDMEKYSDLNSDSSFQGITMDAVNIYLFKSDKKLETNVQMLYDEKFLKFYRVSHVAGECFIKSVCKAEMKKGVCYTVDVKLSLRGAILEAQCECAAGMGPTAHCKHVCTVIFGAAMFAKNKTIKTEETCTQKLQSFHKCKKFKGSPLKAEMLGICGADEFTNIDFDPRPEYHRNTPSYSSYFRSICMNFSGISKMPIFQIFEPANSYAVAHDHDYLRLTPEDIFLESMLITSISDEQIAYIEKKTVGQCFNAAWKQERSIRLTSSMFARICKATDRTDKHKLAQSLTVVSNVKAASLEHGRKHEPVAIERFVLDTNKQVTPCGLFVCKDYPFLASSPDGILDDKSIVEVKCPYVARDKQITSISVPYLKKNSSGRYYLDEKHDYFFQIQGQLLCTGAKNCTLIVCTANDMSVNDVKYINVVRDDIFISELVDRLGDFYRKYFKNALLEKLFYRSFNS